MLCACMASSVISMTFSLDMLAGGFGLGFFTCHGPCARKTRTILSAVDFSMAPGTRMTRLICFFLAQKRVARPWHKDDTHNSSFFSPERCRED